MKTKDGRFYLGIPHSIRKTIDRMSGDDCKAFLKAVFDYSIDGIVSEVPPAAATAYDLTVELIDENAERTKKNRAARQKASNARWHPQGTGEDADDPDPDPVYIKPTVEDIKAFADANGLTTIEPQRYFRHCQLANWKYNGKPMNWQQYAMLLHEKAKSRPTAKQTEKTVTAQNYTQREYDQSFWDEMDADLLAEARKYHEQ